jgi:hypothetical protein
MPVREVTTQSWVSRLAGSIKSVLVGLVLFVVAFPLLFWNEGRAVRTAKSLAEGASGVTSVGPSALDPANDGRLVHMTGNATTADVLRDDAFGVTAPAIALERRVEMYQWREKSESETRNKLGGGTETVTVYSYEKAWDASLIDSGAFKEGGHDNPPEMPFASQRWRASHVALGAFALSPEQIEKIGGEEPFPMGVDHLAELPEDLQENTKVSAGGFYIGDPSTASIGDLKVSYQAIPPHVISIVGVQQAATFAPYQAAAGDAILLVADGPHTAAGMFEAEQAANTLMTWLIRAGGFALMFFGLLMIFKPLSVFGDVIPLVGSLLGAGIGVFAFLVTLCLATVTIAIAWIAYRPLLAVGLFVVAAGAFWFLKMRGAKALKTEAQVAAV